MQTHWQTQTAQKVIEPKCQQEYVSAMALGIAYLGMGDLDKATKLSGWTNVLRNETADYSGCRSCRYFSPFEQMPGLNSSFADWESMRILGISRTQT